MRDLQNTNSQLASAPGALGSFDRVKREFFVYLPLWFLYLEVMGLLHASLANFPDEGFEALGYSRMDFVPSMLIPLVWLVLFFVLRIKKSVHLPSRASRARAWSGAGFLLFVVPLLIIFFHQRNVLDHAQLTFLFEFSQFIWVVLFVVQILATRGRHALVLFFGVNFVYGLMLENTGIVMHYFFEPSFMVYLWFLPAPLCTMLGWSVVFYVTYAIVEKLAEWSPWLKAGVTRRALAATLLALSMDAQLDPLASMSGVFWRWNEALPAGFLGVPFLNFAAWFGAFLPFTWFVFSVTDRTDISEARKNYELFLRVAWSALLGGIICFGIMAIVEGGFDGPTYQILRDFGERLMPY